MKYYDLVFEVGIENDTFHGSYIQSSLVRVSVKAPCAVPGYSLLHVVKHFDGCLFSPFNTADLLFTFGLMTLLQLGAIVLLCIHVCVFTFQVFFKLSC